MSKLTACCGCHIVVERIGLLCWWWDAETCGADYQCGKEWFAFMAWRKALRAMNEMLLRDPGESEVVI